MINRELAELLEKLDNIRRATPLTSDDIDLIVKHIKEEPKKVRQPGPAIGQRYWFAQISHANSYAYIADGFDSDLCEYHDPYPEKRFADAVVRARKLIRDVNKRRRDLNEGKEFGDRQYFILSVTGLEAWGHSDRTYAQWQSYPFGLFKDSSDCGTCIGEFKDELEWFSEEFLPLMAELDDYDWADSPGWREWKVLK